MLANAYPQASNKKTIQDIIQIIHDIEVIAWGKPSHPRSTLVEIAYRDLQHLYGRDRVPPACYLAFFDQLETALLKDNANQSISQFQQAITPKPSCATQKTSFEQASDWKQLVQEIPIKKILTMMQQGKQVVFVDAREVGEYKEYHIPNAVNMPLRQVNKKSAQHFVTADLVVAYCLKDFRGFEVAKALKQRAGIKQAVIMNRYGINGWKEIGLPVVGSRGLLKKEANKKLKTCIADLDHCLPPLKTVTNKPL
jgi:rhodanese-related sulfurtransferase